MLSLKEFTNCRYFWRPNYLLISYIFFLIPNVIFSYVLLKTVYFDIFKQIKLFVYILYHNEK
jgi:hypothetical protein